MAENIVIPETITRKSTASMEKLIKVSSLTSEAVIESNEREKEKGDKQTEQLENINNSVNDSGEGGKSKWSKIKQKLLNVYDKHILRGKLLQALGAGLKRLGKGASSLLFSILKFLFVMAIIDPEGKLFKSLINMLLNVFVWVTKMIAKILPQIIKTMIHLITEVIPPLLKHIIKTVLPALGDMFISLGKDLAKKSPMLGGLLVKLGEFLKSEKLIKALSSLMDFFPEFIIALGIIATLAKIMPILTVIGKVITFIATGIIPAIIAKSIPILVGIGKIITAIVAGVTSAVGIVVIAVIAVIAYFVAIWIFSKEIVAFTEKWFFKIIGWVKDFVFMVYDWINSGTRIAKVVKGIIVGIIALIMAPFALVMSWIVAGQAIFIGMTYIWAKISELIKSGVISKFFTKIIPEFFTKTIPKNIKKINEKIKSLFNKLTSWIDSNFINPVKNSIQGFFIPIFNAVDKIKSLFSIIVLTVKKKLKPFKDFFDKLKNEGLSNIISNQFTKYYRQVKNSMGEVWIWIKNLFIDTAIKLKHTMIANAQKLAITILPSIIMSEESKKKALKKIESDRIKKTGRDIGLSRKSSLTSATRGDSKTNLRINKLLNGSAKTEESLNKLIAALDNVIKVRNKSYRRRKDNSK